MYKSCRVFEYPFSFSFPPSLSPSLPLPTPPPLSLSNISLISNVYLMDISSNGFQILYSPSLSDMLELFSKRIPDSQTLARVPPDSKELKICKTGNALMCYPLYSWLYVYGGTPRAITDTIGTSKLVLLIEMSFVEGSFNIIKHQNGTNKVSLVVRCPLFRGVLYKGFHCIHSVIQNGIRVQVNDAIHVTL